MKKFENKNFRISVPEIIGIAVFFVLFAVAIVCHKGYADTRELFNIEKTHIDFIIQAPSADQVEEISNMDHINKIVPYYYRSASVTVGNKTTKTSLFIIDREDDLEYTPCSADLRIDMADNPVDNPAYISDELADARSLKVGDNFSISIDDNPVNFTVAGIFGSDHRHVGGTVIVIKTDEVQAAMQSSKYSGAYVNSAAIGESANYFESEYIPMGDLRSREEFDSDEAYQIYLDTRSESDTTKDTFVTTEFVNELSKRNDAKLLRNAIFAVIAILLAYICFATILYVRANNYTKHHVLRDVRDNFTIEQEKRMYNRYHVGCLLIMLAGNIGIPVVGFFAIGSNMVSPVGLSGMFLTVLVVSVVSKVSVKRLEVRYALDKKRVENERKRAEKQ